ncbi:MAG: DUF1569 domain-containing protein [Gemmatimonadota bacterium]
MRATIFDPASLRQLDLRIARLQPGSRAQFGTMTPATMVCHLIDALEVALGIAPTVPKRSLLPKPLVRWLVIYVVPWPKGKAKTVPEMLKTTPTSWDTDIARLRALLSDAVRRGPSGQWAADPAFGRLTGRDYGCFIHRHFHHHLSQFGV